MGFPYRPVTETLLITGWNKDGGYHVCRDADGVDRRIDLHVCGSNIPDGDSLIGCRVEIYGSQAYVELASGVKLLPENGGPAEAAKEKTE